MDASLVVVTFCAPPTGVDGLVVGPPFEVPFASGDPGGDGGFDSTFFVLPLGEAGVATMSAFLGAIEWREMKPICLSCIFSIR